MKIKINWIYAIVGVCLFNTALAFKNPIECPNTQAIQSVPLQMAEKIFANQYMAFNLDQYDTDNSWVFAIGPVKANSVSEAINAGNHLLADLSASPRAEVVDGITLCFYHLDLNYAAVAALADDIVKVKHYLRKNVK